MGGRGLSEKKVRYLFLGGEVEDVGGRKVRGEINIYLLSVIMLEM